MRPGREAGFTLVELIAVTGATAILLTLGAFAVRHFWFVRALQGGQDTVVTALRSAQQRSMSESHPNVYGVRFRSGTSTFDVVRYNSTQTPACSVVSEQRLDGGTVFTAATTFPDVPAMTQACTDAAPQAAGSEIVFFFPRGSTNATTTDGSVQLRQPQTGATKTVVVSRLTGRVTRS